MRIDIFHFVLVRQALMYFMSGCLNKMHPLSRIQEPRPIGLRMSLQWLNWLINATPNACK